MRPNVRNNEYKISVAEQNPILLFGATHHPDSTAVFQFFILTSIDETLRASSYFREF